MLRVAPPEWWRKGPRVNRPRTPRVRGDSNTRMQRTSSTVNSPMDVVHLAVGFADMVAKEAREARAPEGTMRAAGRSAREMGCRNIMLRG